jgi:16S rRNA (cytosine967-C5)-methyltransferase
MKLHRSTTMAVIQALEMIFAEGRYADKVIEKILKQNPKWGARDRRFIAETTYDIVRWYVLLRYAARAKEDEYWKLLAAWCILHNISLPAWSEFDGIAEKEIRKRHEDANRNRRLRESVPDWLDELGEQELGDRWPAELQALNEEASVVLRTNTLKISRKDLQRKLTEEDILTQPLTGFSDALVLDQRQNVFGAASFKEGLFEVQDAGSQLIAPFAEVAPGMRVIDACAGAGGKTLHLAALMSNKGRIIAMDVEAWKLEELQKRARRAGVSNLETRLIDSSKVIKRLEATADRVLLDVPCSGLGVLKRNPDAKWKLSLDYIQKVKNLQAQILADYSTLVRPGGWLIYSTCSILPSENEKQIHHFLEQHGNQFEFIKEHHAWPSEGFDGFYMAALQRR